MLYMHLFINKELCIRASIAPEVHQECYVYCTTAL